MHPENTSRELQKELYTSLTRTTLNTCLSKQISWRHSPIFLSANQWWKTGNPCAVGPANDPAGSELCSVSLTIDSTALPDSHAGTVCQECPTWEAFLWTPPKSLCCMAVCSIILLRLHWSHWSHRFCREHESNQLDKVIDFYDCTCTEVTIVLGKATFFEYLCSAGMGKHQSVTCFDALSLLSLPHLAKCLVSSWLV